MLGTIQYVVSNLKELPDLQAAAASDKAVENRQTANGAHHPPKAVLLCWPVERQT